MTIVLCCAETIFKKSTLLGKKLVKNRLILCTDQEGITQMTVQICEYLYVMDLILHL